MSSLRGVEAAAMAARSCARVATRHNARLAFGSGRLAVSAMPRQQLQLRTPAGNPSRSSWGQLVGSGVARHFSAKVEIKVAELGGESITEGTLVAWTKKVGDFCAKDEVIASIETDKVTVDVKATENGTLAEILAKEDDTVEVGSVLCTMTPGGEAPAAGAAAAAPAPSAAAAPAAAPAPAPAPAPVAAPKAAAAPAGLKAGERREKMNRMRQTIARRLKDAQNTSVMLSTFQEVDMSGLMALRKEYKELFEKQHGGVRLGFMSAFVKASAMALQRVPAVNAVIDDKTNEIVYPDYVDISVAVASPKGLVVPVLRSAEKMSIYKVEATIAELAGKAKTGALTMDDMTGGTFTISNGGVFGSMLGTPIINPPQTAVLGMHATKQRAVVLKNGEVAARPVMYLALTYDHRLVDGREAAAFLNIIRDAVEDPRRLVLDV